MSKIPHISFQQSSQDTQDILVDTLTLETHESKSSPGHSNTTSSITVSSTNETPFTTSLTFDSSQLTQTSGLIGGSSRVQVSSSQLKEDKGDKHISMQDNPVVLKDTENSHTNPHEEQVSLRSIGLVRNVMSTSTTFTTSSITSTHKLTVDAKDYNPDKEVSQLEPPASSDMASSVDSSLWGDSSMVDSVIKVEQKTTSEDHDDKSPNAMTSSTERNEETLPSEGRMEVDEGNSKTLVGEDQSSMNIVEVEEVKMTISHLSFNVPSSSSREVSPVPDYPPEEFPPKDRKRKITESETDLDNFDDLIAGLKEVAEKDYDLTSIDKTRRDNSEKDLDTDQGGDERFSLLKIRRRDDDDLESLASVDTDMAPASETSRDFEATYSDLESVSESVSSRGDNLFSPASSGLSSVNTSKLEEIRTVEHISQRTQIITSESVSHPYVSSAEELTSPRVEQVIEKQSDESIFKLVTNEKTNDVRSEDNSQKHQNLNEKNYRTTTAYEELPVEKLQAMIAELEEVMSDTEITDSDGEKENVNVMPDDTNVLKEDLNQAEVPNNDVVMKDTEVLQKEKEELEALTGDLDETDAKSLPIEFKIQEIHVAGDIEFAQAKSIYEKPHTSPLEMPSKLVITSTSVEDHFADETKEKHSPQDPENTSTVNNKTATIKEDKTDISEGDSLGTVQKVSVQSAQVVHGITLVSSSENRLPEAEEAVLVTLISRSSSVEAIATDSESTEGKNVALEQVREENTDTDADVSDLEETVDEHISRLAKKDTDKDRTQKDIYEEVDDSPASSGSSDSSDDEDASKKTRRPTVIECPALTVALDEELAKSGEKVSIIHMVF